MEILRASVEVEAEDGKESIVWSHAHACKGAYKWTDCRELPRLLHVDCCGEASGAYNSVCLQYEVKDRHIIHHADLS